MHQRYMVLTGREREVAELVAQGLTNHAIAERLSLSERTVEGHIEHAFNKLGLTSRTQLAMWLGASGEPGRAPPRGAGSFPAQLTSFIGRQRDITAVQRLLFEHRIVTLTGIGGSGKTRLALELVKHLQSQDKTRIWLVDVSTVGDPALLAQATAASVGVLGRGSPVDALVDRLRKVAGVLLLDNCEHVTQACAELVTAMATQCPEIKFLMTSREPIRVAGEATWRVPHLALPAKRASFDQVTQAESVKLFEERARLVEPGFEIDKSNCDAIGEVCRRLDGLPLAIELAAARIGLLSPSQIVAKLDDRFSLLAGDARVLPARHQTLKATLQWSYDLLPDTERWLFRRLAVFTGTFNLEAGQAVCGLEPLDSGSILETLGRLIDKSLVSATGAVRNEARYRLLDSTRAFASELLSKEPEAELIAERHARLYASIALEAGRHLGGPDATDWIELVAEEMDNLRAALLWAISNEQQLALGMCASLAGYWDFHGWLFEGRHWLERALHGTEESATVERASALAAAGMLAFRQADYGEARRRFEASLKVAEVTGDRALSARALAGLGDVLVITGDPDGAMTRYSTSLDLYRAENDLLSVARGLSRLAGVHNVIGEYETAEKLCQESLDAFRQLGDRLGIANQLSGIGFIRFFTERFQSARTHLKESLTLRRELGDTVGIAWTSTWLAGAETQLGNLGEACQPLMDGLRGCKEAGDLRGFSLALDMTLSLFLAADLAGPGVRVGSAAADIRRQGGFQGMPPFTPVAERWLTQARAHLQPDQAEHEEMLGRSMSPAAALQFAIDHIQSIPVRMRSGAKSRLTQRERQIAALIAEGLTNREIADRLHISERTADSHVQHTMSKLGFKSRAQIAAWYARNDGREPAIGGGQGAVDHTAAPIASRFVATILVLDIVGSTARLAEVGDASWRELLDEHYRLARVELGRHRGVEIDTAGDGLLATFDGPATAIRCARAIQRADRGIGLSSRAGVHAGEIERAGAAIRGIAVHLTARLAGLGHADEILVSTTARDLSAGSGLRFLDRGFHQLKGLSDPRQVYAVSN
jgi:predicted ATPase/DNA-binding NarL/FixJ family response regulator